MHCSILSHFRLYEKDENKVVSAKRRELERSLKKFSKCVGKEVKGNKEREEDNYDETVEITEEMITAIRGLKRRKTSEEMVLEMRINIRKNLQNQFHKILEYE